MTNRWYCMQIERAREISAAMFMAGAGIEPLVPVIPIWRMVKGKREKVNVSRFGVYIFGRFDVEESAWHRLSTAEAKRAGVVRLLCSKSDHGPWPIPVPDKSIEVIRAYIPQEPVIASIHRYSPGEPCFVVVGGVRKPAVFVEYCGNRPMIRTWIFGHQRIAEARAADLEPQDVVDNTENRTTIGAS